MATRRFTPAWKGIAIAFMAMLVVWAQPTRRVNAAPNGETYKARLSTVPIDVTMMSTVAGSGSVTAELAGNKLTIDGKFAGLRSPATTARIHRGPKGIRGPAIFDITVSKETSGTIGGSVELTPAQIDDLKNGRLYVQISSERAPDGNLWGWLLR